MRKIPCLFLVLFLALSILAGCGQKHSTSVDPAENSTSTIEDKTKSESPDTDLSEKPEESHDTSDSETELQSDNGAALDQIEEVLSGNETGSLEISEHFSASTEVQCGEEVQGNSVRLVFETAYLSKTVLPDTMDSSYSYLKENDGYTYLVCRGSLENQSNRQFEMNSTNIGGSTPYILLAQYGETYYLGKIWTETTSLDSISTKIDAGKKVPFLCVFTIPTEKVTEGLSSMILFGFDDFSEKIYDSNFGSPKIFWSSCSSLINVSFDHINVNA